MPPKQRKKAVKAKENAPPAKQSAAPGKRRCREPSKLASHRNKAQESNKDYLQTMLTQALKQRKLQSLSDTGHAFVGVDRSAVETTAEKDDSVVEEPLQDPLANDQLAEILDLSTVKAEVVGTLSRNVSRVVSEIVIESEVLEVNNVSSISKSHTAITPDKRRDPGEGSSGTAKIRKPVSSSTPRAKAETGDQYDLEADIGTDLSDTSGANLGADHVDDHEDDQDDDGEDDIGAGLRADLGTDLSGARGVNLGADHIDDHDDDGEDDRDDDSDDERDDGLRADDDELRADIAAEPGSNHATERRANLSADFGAEFTPDRAACRQADLSGVRSADIPPSPQDPGEGTSGSKRRLSITEDSDEPGNNDDRYQTLLNRYKSQSEALKKSRKKITKLTSEVAELKDLVLDTVAEAKKAKNPNAPKSFTTDPAVQMTEKQIEEINNMSAGVGNFAQNLAMHLYGAQNLRMRSVTGKTCNRFSKDGRPAKPGISPEKLKFIYAKAKERVALEKGESNYTSIETLANPKLINRALAEKIANLNKPGSAKK